jgi:hypothetical protein
MSVTGGVMDGLSLQTAYQMLFDVPAVFKDTSRFLSELNPDSLKKTFRKKALQYHPDRAVILGVHEKVLEKQFRQISASYQFLLNEINGIKKTGLNHTRKTQADPRPDTFRERPKKEESFNRHHQQSPHETFYRGFMPQRPLRFAEFLYYTGRISWKTLIRALVWQMEHRPRFGDLALHYRYLTRENILEIIRHSSSLRRFGETAIQLGMLSKSQVSIILGRQLSFAAPIGRFFIDQSILNQKDLDRELNEMRLYNLKTKMKRGL